MQPLSLEQLKSNVSLGDDIVAESGSQQIHLTQVSVNGGDTFSDSFYQKLMSPLLEGGDCTLKQLVNNISTARSALVGTDVFKDVNVTVTSDYTTLLPQSAKIYGSEKPVAAKLVFDVILKNMCVTEGILNINSEDHMNIGLDYFNGNFNGNAESVNFGVDYNPYKPNDRLLTRARIASNMRDPSIKLVIDLQHGQQNNLAWQLACENTSYGSVGLQRTHCHNIILYTGLSMIKRSLRDIQADASDQVKACLGETVKSSFVSAVSYDNRKYTSAVLPSSGNKTSISVEASSSQRQEQNTLSTFLKGMISTQIYRGFFNNWLTANIAASAGLIHSMSNGPVHVSDRFYLGGLNSFSGFDKKAVNVDGGHQFFRLGSTIYGAIPHLIFAPPGNIDAAANPLRWFVSGQVGNVDKSILSLKSVAASIGTGIKYIHEYANFEAGYYMGRRLNDNSSLGIKDGLLFSVTVGGTNRNH